MRNVWVMEEEEAMMPEGRGEVHLSPDMVENENVEGAKGVEYDVRNAKINGDVVGPVDEQAGDYVELAEKAWIREQGCLTSMSISTHMQKERGLSPPTLAASLSITTNVNRIIVHTEC